MPTIQNGNATLYYEEHGKGFPIFTFAPKSTGAYEYYRLSEEVLSRV